MPFIICLYSPTNKFHVISWLCMNTFMLNTSLKSDGSIPWWGVNNVETTLIVLWVLYQFGVLRYHVCPLFFWWIGLDLFFRDMHLLVKFIGGVLIWLASDFCDFFIKWIIGLSCWCRSGLDEVDRENKLHGLFLDELDVFLGV